jgi:hypothetical protein
MLPFPEPEVEETMLIQGEDEVTVQLHSEAIPWIITARTLARKPIEVDAWANVGLQTNPAWLTLSTWAPRVALQFVLWRMRWPVRATPMLSGTEY